MSGAREEPTPRLTVLAGLAVEAGAAAAGARGGVTGAAVVAGAVQAAGGTVAPGGAGCGEPRVSILPRKARATRAAGRPPSRPRGDAAPAGRCSPSSQCSPVQPRPQEQLPSAAWQRPPFLQEHACSQLTPNRSRGQSADTRRAAQSSGPRLDVLWDASPPALTFIQQTLPGPSLGPSPPPGHVCIQERQQPVPPIHPPSWSAKARLPQG